jgi:hypothetical protein
MSKTNIADLKRNYLNIAWLTLVSPSIARNLGKSAIIQIKSYIVTR